MTQTSLQANPSQEKELSLLALKAAMQIDAIRRKEAVEADYVAQLTERLKGGLAGPTVEYVKELAPPTTGVMQRAISAFNNGWQPQSNEDLAGGITDLLANLDAPLEKTNDELLVRLLSFCVTLHDELLLQKRFVEDTKRPKSRFRV